MKSTLPGLIMLEYGLWDEIRVDHGKEFYLMALHARAAHPHIATDVQPERIWVEVNKRVTYPVIVLMDDERKWMMNALLIWTAALINIVSRL